MVNWLYIDFNSFFASCEQQEKPYLRGKPIAVVPMKADSTFCLAASYEAKAFGVKTGVRVSDAKKMCPGLILAEANHQIYVKYHHKVIESIEKCIPVHSVCSIDEVACELTGSQKNINIASQVALKIKRQLAIDVGEHIKCSIGLSTNLLLSKIATDMQKPDGLTSIELTDLPHKLFTLKLQDIPGVGRKMECHINQKNIFTVEKLLQQNEMQMRGIWGGIVGARYYKLLKGENLSYSYSSFSQSEQGQAPKSISHQHVLPPIQRNYNEGFIIACKLLNKAALRLRRGKLMAKQLSLYIRFLDQTHFLKSIKIEECQDSITFIRNLKILYNQISKKKKPLKISVVLFDLIDEGNHQYSFFNNERLNFAFKAVDKINEKFGRDTIYVGTLHDNKKSAPTRIAFSRIPKLDEVSDED